MVGVVVVVVVEGRGWHFGSPGRTRRENWSVVHAAHHPSLLPSSETF